MSIIKKWAEHCDAIEKVRSIIEDIASQLPESGSGRKQRKAITDAWRIIGQTTDDIDELLNAAVQPLPIKFPWKDKEFMELWSLYKDFLWEQYGFQMKSRMENSRLNAIRDFCNGDRKLAMRSINFYMAYGTVGVFPVDFKNIKSEDKLDDPTKFTIKVS